MPQSHPTTGPVRFLSPVRFLAPKAGWSARRSLTSALFPWSHQATGPVRLDTSTYIHTSHIYIRIHTYIHQSHPTTGPVRFLSLARFLARKAEWSGRRNFTSVLFSWSHQATDPARLDTVVYLWFGWIIRRTPREPRAMPIPASHGNQCFSYPTRPVRGPCMTRKGAERRPDGHVRELTQP